MARIPQPTLVVPPPLATPPNDSNERHAQALADIRAMHDELNMAHETIGQLKADLNREQDRVNLLIEERDRYRIESNQFRTHLIELATQQTNIGLLTIKAQEIVRIVNELTATTTRLPTNEWVNPDDTEEQP